MSILGIGWDPNARSVRLKYLVYRGVQADAIIASGAFMPCQVQGTGPDNERTAWESSVDRRGVRGSSTTAALWDQGCAVKPSGDLEEPLALVPPTFGLRKEEKGEIAWEDAEAFSGTYA